MINTLSRIFNLALFVGIVTFASVTGAVGVGTHKTFDQQMAEGMENCEG